MRVLADMHNTTRVPVCTLLAKHDDEVPDLDLRSRIKPRSLFVSAYAPAWLDSGEV